MSALIKRIEKVNNVSQTHHNDLLFIAFFCDVKICYFKFTVNYFCIFHYEILFICSAGGLVTAVAPVVIKGNGLWVGWAGLHSPEPITEIPESDPNDQTPTAGLRSDQVIFKLILFLGEM